MLKEYYKIFFTGLLAAAMVTTPVQAATPLAATIDRVAATNRFILQAKTYDNLLKIIAVTSSDRDRQFINALRAKIGKTQKIPRVKWVGTDQLHIDGLKPDIQVRDLKDRMFVLRGQVLYLKRQDSFRTKVLWLQRNWFDSKKDFAVAPPRKQSWMAFLKQFFHPFRSEASRGNVKAIYDLQRTLGEPEELNLADIKIPNSEANSHYVLGLRYSVAALASLEGLAGSRNYPLLSDAISNPAMLEIILLSDKAYGASIDALPVSLNCSDGAKITYSDGGEIEIKKGSDRYSQSKDIYDLCTNKKRKLELARVKELVAQIDEAHRKGKPVPVTTAQKPKPDAKPARRRTTGTR